jgi:uncharacterized membrane protein (UPF0127 family)
MEVVIYNSSVKKFIIVISSLILLVTAYSLLPNQRKISQNIGICKTDFDIYDVIAFKIYDKHYRLLVADKDLTHQHGLMGVTSRTDICGHDGMIFEFEKAGIQTFWNQNTFVDLKLYFMLSDYVVREDNLQNIKSAGLKIYSSFLPVDRVIEIIK